VPEVQSAPIEEQEKYLEEIGYRRRQVWRQSPSTRTRSSRVQGQGQTAEYNEEDDQIAEYAKHIGADHNYLLPDRTSPHQSRKQSSIIANNSFCASLYERTRNHLNRRDYHQKNPVYAYGDPPLPDIDTSFLLCPPESTAQALINKYFDFVSATNRILHRPTIEKWTRELLNSGRGINSGDEENSQRAVVLMIFASSLEYMGGDLGESDTDTR
jgi:hypothetical protein